MKVGDSLYVEHPTKKRLRMTKEFTLAEYRATLLDRLVCRKPSTKDDIPFRRLGGLDESTLLLMKKLTIRYALGPLDPMRSRIFKDEDLLPLMEVNVDDINTVIFLLKVVHNDQDPEYYFVNTEGYDYMRYCFRIHPEDFAVLQGSDPLTITLRVNNRLDLGHTLAFALRYAMGRMTFAPSIVMDLVRSNLHLLSEDEIGLLVSDIEDARNLGEGSYRDRWLEFKNTLVTHLPEDQRDRWLRS